MAEGYACRTSTFDETFTQHQLKKASESTNNCSFETSVQSQNNMSSDSTPAFVGFNTINITCRYFLKGVCRYGDSCRFAHREIRKTDAGMQCTSQVKDPGDMLTNTTFRSGISSFEDWVNAPEFVPASKCKSYAEVVTQNLPEEVNLDSVTMCPYVDANGVCNNIQLECPYLHGEVCDFCGLSVLHPYDEEVRKQHTQACIEQHERDMELSFAIARSKEKTCGVCFEVVMDKSTQEQRFGILPNCNHCFCLTCIRKWRQARQFDNKIIRSCPECRVSSDFVCPSEYWVDTKEEKEKLITEYKNALSVKDCKYFKQGSGKCPFGNKCFYLHALPDGTKKDVGPPPRQTHRHHSDHDPDIEMVQHFVIWDLFADTFSDTSSTNSDDTDDSPYIMEIF